MADYEIPLDNFGNDRLRVEFSFGGIAETSTGV